MPEPASSRSLEDILASIRKSLADDTVDGLVELSAAAVDAARAEQTSQAARSLLAQVPGHDADAAPRSAADALADDLLRDKLAGALVLDETAEGESEAAVAARDEAASDDFGQEDAAEPAVDDATLAKLWVLRPGIEQARPAGPPQGLSQSLSLDPFPRVAPGSGGGKPSVDFNLSPRDLLGDTRVLGKPLPSMPPLPQASSPPAAAVAEQKPTAVSGASGAPRLDADSIALLQKLRASNAAAIEKMAKENEAPEEEEPETAIADVHAIENVAIEADASVTDVEAEASATAASEPVFPFAELPADVPEAAPVAPLDADPDAITQVVRLVPVATVTADAPAVLPATEEEARPLLSLPERSTPLFGGHADARPPVTSGLDHLLPEDGAAPLEVADEPVNDVVAEVPAEVPEAILADVAPEPELEAAAETVVAEAVAPQSDAEPAHVALDAAAEVSLSPVAETEAASVTPVVGNKALEDMIAAVLEPVLQRLIETNIGPALEALVRREVERVLKEQRPPE